MEVIHTRIPLLMLLAVSSGILFSNDVVYPQQDPDLSAIPPFASNLLKQEELMKEKLYEDASIESVTVK